MRPHGSAISRVPVHPRDSRRTVAGIFALTLAIYFPALNGGLVWDDAAHLTAPALQSLDGLRRIWFELGATQQYYPLLHSAFWLEHKLWGDAVLGYHLVNIALHATAACLFFSILRQLAVPGSRLASFVFAAHPVAVESVAWISEQKNTLSLVFYLCAALAYLRFDRERRPRFYFAALACFVLALLTKTVTATLPGALLLILWWQRGRLGVRRDVVPLVSWFILGAAAGLFTAWVERTWIGAQGPEFALTATQRTLLAGRVIWFYLGKLAWPTDLMFIYPRWNVAAEASAWWIHGAAVLALMASLWTVRRHARGPLTGWLFFIGSLFPVLGFLNVYPFVFSYVADHFQYLPSLGIIAVASAGMAQGFAVVRTNSAKLALISGAAVVVASLAALSWRQAGTFRDAPTLYRATIARNPDCFLAHSNLADLLRLEGRKDEAIAHYREALRIKPEILQARAYLASLLSQLGRRSEAIEQYEHAVRLGRSPKLHLEFALTLEHAGRISEAFAQANQALQLAPDSSAAHGTLAAMLLRAGRSDEAIVHSTQATRLSPGDAAAHHQLGYAFARAGRFADAISCYEHALRLQPRLARAHFDLALALARFERLSDAIRHLRAALRLEPELPTAHGILGDLLMLTQHPAEAIGPYRKAVRAEPRNAALRNSLGTALLLIHRFDEAIVQFREALRLQPDYPDAQRNLQRALDAADTGQRRRRRS